jgi:uncharacterized delta-60 repeat protein
MRHAPRRRGNRPRLRVENLEARALLASAGSLDPTFGGGYGYTTVPTGIAVPTGLAVQNTVYTPVQTHSVITLPDGHSVVSATISANPTGSAIVSALAIEELNPDGSLDTSFGTNGLAVVQVGYATTWTAAVQPNGQIIEARSSFVSSYNTDAENSLIAFRLNTNGTLDTTFGTNGFFEYPADTTIPSQDRLFQVTTVLPLPSGQIILAGTATPAVGFTTLRLNANGSIDTTYGTGGTTNVTVPSSSNPEFEDIASAAVLQSNGQVVLTGTFDDENEGEFLDRSAIVIRLNADGTLDTTFADGGIAVLPVDPSNLAAEGFTTALAVAVQPTSGDLLVMGTAQVYGGGGGFQILGASYYTIDRLNPNGTLDTSFATNGQALPPIPSKSTLASMTIQANGDILLAGSTQNSYGSSSSATQNLVNVDLLRLGPGGSPDASFGNTSTTGLLLTRLNTSAPDLAIQPVNNDIITFGVSIINALSGQTYGLTVDSLLPVATGPAATPPPPSPPANLLGLNTTDLAVYNPKTGSFVYNSATNAINTSLLSSYMFAFGSAGSGQTIPAVADYQGLGYDQIGAYLPASGVYAILPTPTSPGLFKQFGMAGVGNSIPVPADYYGTGQADVAVYMPSSASFAILAPGNATGKIVQFGSPGAGQSIPAPADYYNTGQADLAVYLAQAGEFAILAPGGTTGEIIPFGKPGLGASIPVPGDYDGSGKTELAVYIPSQGAFYYRPANGGPDVRVPIGTANAGYIPVPGDYDGSGRTEVAIYDAKTGVILYQPAKGGPALGFFIGTANDGSIPVAAPAGALPEFAASSSGSGSGSDAVRAESVPAVTSGSTASITVSPVSSVPAGPTLASVRVARSLINQAAPDPFEAD